ncbi:MAG: glycosyltransferase [Cyanophyceae cyanobacterium]
MNIFSDPFVSVVIPVFNDAERLKICLKALKAQTYPKTLYEVIVVDNASDEGQDIQGVVAQFDSAIAAFESTPGSYAARNRGLALAKGEVIAFTDADCVPAADWLEKGVKALLRTPNCGLVAGKIELFFKDPSRLTSIELFEKITAFAQKQLLEQYKGGATANIFTFRKVIEQVGNFDTSFKSGGDLEWGKRVFEHGYQQIYAEDVQVAHPARYSWGQIYRRTMRITAGLYSWQCRKAKSQFEQNTIFIICLAQNLIPPLNFMVSTFRDSRLKGLKPKLKVSLVMLFVRYITALEVIRLKLGGIPVRN